MHGGVRDRLSKSGFLRLYALWLDATAQALITLPLGHAQGCTGCRHTEVFCGGLCFLRCDKPILASLPLLIGGVKQIIVLFSVAFSQETNSKAILLNYHVGENSILQLWFKPLLQYRMKPGVCMSFLQQIIPTDAGHAGNPTKGVNKYIGPSYLRHSSARKQILQIHGYQECCSVMLPLCLCCGGESCSLVWVRCVVRFNRTQISWSLRS